MSMKDFVDTLSEEQKKALLEALTGTQIERKMHPEPSPEPTEEDFLNKNNPDFSMFSEKRDNKKRGPVSASKNTWVDTGESREIETPKISPTSRNRKPAKEHSVNCHVCGKTFKINPKFSYGEYHRCNNCAGNK